MLSLGVIEIEGILGTIGRLNSGIIMDIDRSITKVTDPADPNRCQGVFSGGQCLNKAVPGCEYCMEIGRAHV